MERPVGETRRAATHSGPSDASRPARGYHGIVVSRSLVTACSAAALACAAAPTKPVPMPSTGATAGGEVFFIPSGSPGTSAAFDDRRVVGPNVNMGTSPEGDWGGDLLGRNLVLAITDGRLSGAAFEVVVEREGEALRLAGLLGDRRVSARLSPKLFQGTIDGGVCSFELTREAPGSYRGAVACTVPGVRNPVVNTAQLKLLGDAARLDQPVLPQLALAVLAVLPL